MAVTYQQLGNDATTNNNITLRANGDGTFSICKGTVASPTEIFKIDASGNILGTTGAVVAPAGYVGELLSDTLASGSATSLVTATAKNVISKAFTAGDWDIWGATYFTIAASTVVTQLVTSLSQTTGTLDTTIGQFTNDNFPSGNTPTSEVSRSIQPVRFNFSTTTTVYLVARASFTVSTISAYGGIFGRRVR